MRYQSIMLMFLLSLVLPLGAKVSSADEDGKLHVYNIWASALRAGAATEDGATFNAVYFQIENNTDNTVVLTEAESTIAEAVEMRDAAQTLVESVEIPAGESLTFAPDGYHLSLLNPMETYETGDAFPITLRFDTGEDELTEIIAAALVIDSAPEPSPFVIYDAWARFALSGEGSVSAVYLALENRGDEVDRLINISTEAAKVVEIHASTIDNDIMSMSPVESLDIPADQLPVQINGEPYHLMLINLTQDLMIGDAVSITLHFESGQEVSVALPILLDAIEQEEEHSH
jgi:periplasmic copper chaperone A